MAFSEKDKKQLMVIIGGALVIPIVLIVASPKKSPPRASSASDTTAQASGKPVSRTVLPGQDLYGELEKEAASLKPTRDPFAFALSKKGLRLMGIIWNESAPQAVINNIIVKEGDSLDTNTVILIKPNKVVLSDGTNNFELTLD